MPYIEKSLVGSNTVRMLAFLMKGLCNDVQLFVLTQVQQQQQSAQADTMKSSVNGYHESLIEALRNAAATTSSQRGSNSSNSFGLGAGGGANTGGAGSNHRSSAASLTVNFHYKGTVQDI